MCSGHNGYKEPNNLKLSNSVTDLTKAIDTLEESILNLQTFIKYQQFDLEATRRERDHFKKMFEEKNG